MAAVKREPRTRKRQEEATLIRLEPQEAPLDMVIVKTENNGDKSSVPHQRAAVQNGEGPNREADPSSEEEEATDVSEEPFSCSECGKTFKWRSHLLMHEPVHRGGVPDICKVCKKKFRNRSELKVHKLTHKEEKLHKCSECTKKFSTRSELSLHRKLHKGKLHKCSNCKKSFITKSELKSHMSRHKEKVTKKVVPSKYIKVLKPYSCSKCKRKFKIKRELNQHMKVHIEKPFLCSVCMKCFSLIDVLKHHQLKQHHICPLCPKACTSNMQLAVHLRLHKKDGSLDPESNPCRDTRKPYSCSKCKQRFPYQSGLKNHWKIHVGQGPLQCHMCGKRFKSQSQYQTHLKYHRSTRPFKCSVCKETFKSNPKLQKHMKVHQREGPTVCSVCDKRFRGKIGYLQHMKTHSERPGAELQHESTQEEP